MDRTDPLSFGPKFPEILIEWIAQLPSFELSKFILGSETEGNKTKKLNYSFIDFNAISLVLYP